MVKSFISIRAKLFMGLIAITGILILSVLLNLYIISNTKSNANEVIKTELPIYNTLVDLNSEVFLASNAMQLWFITHNEKYKVEVNKIWEVVGIVQLNLDNLISHSNNDKINSKWGQTKILINALKQMGSKLFNVSDNTIEKTMIETEYLPLIDKLNTSLNEINSNEQTNSLLDIQYNHLNSGSQKILSDMYMLSVIEYVLLIFSIISSITIAIITANKIVIPIKHAINVAQLIANGERKVKITRKSEDETGQLLSSLDTMQKAIKEGEDKLQQNEAKTRSMFNNIVKSANIFSAHTSKVASGDLRQHLEINHSEDVMNQLGEDLNKMTENLSTITKEITQACQNMVTTVEEVRHAVNTQSSGASEQASSINEISASLSEIEKSSTQTMEKAKSLGESAEMTREKGQLGLEAVDQSVNGMNKVRNKVELIAQTILELSNQTQQVGEITAVVNNLAQQSKMLALNASIEAAKAGEAGKGFAVVAVEVKNLAEQSEQATSQVQKILENIRHAADKAVMVTEEGTKEVDEGTSLVEQTGEIIRNLNEVIHETTIASQQIESAVRQESAGIEQITIGMNEINQVTASFVESVKQTTEAISNLAEIARNLKSYIDTYKI